MTLMLDDIAKIMEDELSGRDPKRVLGKEADDFRKKLKPDLELAREKGWVVDIPKD